MRLSELVLFATTKEANKPVFYHEENLQKYFHLIFLRCMCRVYTIIAPRQIRPNATYLVSLTYVANNDTNQPPPLVTFRIDDSTGNQIFSRNVRLVSDSTMSLDLPTDAIEYYKYYRLIAAVEGVSFEHSLPLQTGHSQTG